MSSRGEHGQNAVDLGHRDTHIAFWLQWGQADTLSPNGQRTSFATSTQTVTVCSHLLGPWWCEELRQDWDLNCPRGFVGCMGKAPTTVSLEFYKSLNFGNCGSKSFMNRKLTTFRRLEMVVALACWGDVGEVFRGRVREEDGSAVTWRTPVEGLHESSERPFECPIVLSRKPFACG